MYRPASVSNTKPGTTIRAWGIQMGQASKVLVSPAWITGVHWSNSTVSADLSRAAIKASPPYDAKALLDRKWEHALYKHYRRTGYWSRAEALHSQH